MSFCAAHFIFNVQKIILLLFRETDGQCLRKFPEYLG